MIDCVIKSLNTLLSPVARPHGSCSPRQGAGSASQGKRGSLGSCQGWAALEGFGLRGLHGDTSGFGGESSRTSPYTPSEGSDDLLLLKVTGLHNHLHVFHLISLFSS